MDWLGTRCYGFSQQEYLALSISTQTDKGADLKSLVIPVLLYGCETWTLNADLKRRIDAFGSKSLRRIMGYRWNDYMSNQRLFPETESGPVTSIIWDHRSPSIWMVATYTPLLPLGLLSTVSIRSLPVLGSVVGGGAGE